MNSNLKVIAVIKVLPDCIGTAQAVFKELIAQTRQEIGCISYVLLQNIEDPPLFTFVEEWVDENALTQHSQSAHVAHAISQLSPLLAQAPDIKRYFEV